MDIRVLDDPAGECAELLARAAEAGHHIVLTGGSTPRAAYERAAGLEADWSRAKLWWSDERCVPPDDELSNFGMAKRALLDRLPETGDGGPDIHRIAGERGPHPGADDYERELRETLGEEIPRFDLILLGMGPDGHVASLFPGQDTLHASDRGALGVDHAGLEPYVPRISLTLPVLRGGRHVVFLVTGRDKADVVARAFVGEATPELPASLVRPTQGELTLLLDEGAAEQLGPLR